MYTVSDHVTGVLDSDQGKNRPKDGLVNKLKWKLALEKAYINQDRQSASSNESSLNSRYKSKSCLTSKKMVSSEARVSMEPIEKNVEAPAMGVRNACQSDLCDQQTIVSSMVIRSAVCHPKMACSNGVSQIVPTQTTPRVQLESIANQYGAQNAGKTESESMLLIKSEDGLVLVIRSWTMVEGTALKLVREVNRRLMEKGQQLVKVIINGQTLWTKVGNLPSEHIEIEDFEHQINKAY